MALPQIESKSDNSKYYLTHYEADSGAETKYGDVSCGLYKERFTASLALGIIGLIFLAATLVIGVVTVITATRNPIILIAGGVTNCVASVFLLTCWALTVAFYDGGATYCGAAVPKDSDQKIGVGLALLISSWCIMAVSGCCAAGSNASE
eukprot:TRINITY_DN36889_c0_g1_i1.p1 TRINITY_DN36889_c0_g1~~TRINITY_DN36889_c0_g1_i1.p1  ORF type:complete len:150 (+),score=32.56 TRINITY_DN36889_c0_g1_i1:189-638(+)